MKVAVTRDWLMMTMLLMIIVVGSHGCGKNPRLFKRGAWPQIFDRQPDNMERVEGATALSEVTPSPESLPDGEE